MVMQRVAVLSMHTSPLAQAGVGDGGGMNVYVRELVSSLAFAAAQTTSHMSVTFNQVYGAAVLNSTLCLGCFLAVLAHQRLPWTFGPEVAVILLPTLLLGAFACRRRSWPAAWGAGALAMYPLALLLQWGLTRLAARA